MSDNDTRAKAKFEPPPWEREAFDALAAKRAEDEAALAALELIAASERAKESQDTADAPADAPSALIDIVPAAEVIPESAASEAGAIAAPAVDESAVEAMLLKLQAEEATDGTATRWVGWIASALTFVLGGGMLVYGLLSVRGAEAKFANVVGSAVLSVFGMCFMGMAVWVWVSTSRSKGR